MPGISHLCPNRNTLHLYLSERLTDDDADQIDSHLSGCETCQRQVELLIGDAGASLDDTTTPSKNMDVPPDVSGLDRLREIAVGGMGIIWLVRDRRFDRLLALKVMQSRLLSGESAVWRFEQEARVCALLDHPYIVPIHARGILPDGRPYYTMKYVEGQTLAWRLAAQEEVRELLRIFLQVCEAVAFAHDQAVIHRDLKPDNIMVDRHGNVQLMDWGLAKVTAESMEPFDDKREDHAVFSETGMTQAGVVMGTYAYMSPEQALGRTADVDSRTDVFALGSILCEILTGSPAYDGLNGDVRDAARGADVAHAVQRLRGSHHEPALIRLAIRCLSPERESRPTNAGEVVRMLQDHMKNERQRLEEARYAHKTAHLRASEERRRRKITTAWMSVLACMAMILAGAFGLQAYRATRQQRLSAELQNHLDRAETLRAKSNVDGMNAAYRDAEAAIRALLQLAGDKTPHYFSMARCQSKWADALTRSGRHKDSLPHYRRSTEVREQLRQLAPLSRRYQLGLTHARLAYANALLRANKVDPAAAEFERTRKTLDALRQNANNDDQAQIDGHLALVLRKHAQQQRETGNPGQADKLLSEARKLRVDLSDLDVEHRQLGVPGWRQCKPVEPKRDAPRPHQGRGDGRGMGWRRLLGDQ